jgi:hypothetical protein
MELAKKTILIFFFLLLSCKKNESKKDNMEFITKKKWMSYNDNIQSPWNSKIMPQILDFSQNYLMINFSNYKHSYQIKNDSLFINKTSKFKFEMFENETLILTTEKTTEKYFELKQGKFNEKDKLNLENLFQDNFVLFLGYKTKFAFPDLSLFDNKDNFYRAGIVHLMLYNNQIIFLINIDGEIQKNSYILQYYNQKKIVLKKVIYSSEADEVILKVM